MGVVATSFAPLAVFAAPMDLDLVITGGVFARSVAHLVTPFQSDLGLTPRGRSVAIGRLQRSRHAGLRITGH